MPRDDDVWVAARVGHALRDCRRATASPALVGCEHRAPRLVERLRHAPHFLGVAEHTCPRTVDLDELFVDLPSTGDSDRAHAVAALVLPFVRRMVSGCTPLHLIEAPTPGMGKGLLADIIAIVALGRPCDPTTITPDEDEARKKITSILSRAQPLTDLMTQLGHSHLDTTQIYAASISGRRRATVMAMDFGTAPAVPPEARA